MHTLYISNHEIDGRIDGVSVWRVSHRLLSLEGE